jgi:adenosylmethionine-8-amino-7-oxononanoate aminotransferase
MNLIQPIASERLARIVSADGSTLITEEGLTILDGCSGAISCSIGYGHPHVTATMSQQAGVLSFAYRSQFKNAPAERLAQRLCEKLGYASAFFVNSGSEAVEAAVRTALQYWQEMGRPEKRLILSRKISYHGSTNGTLGLSGHWPRRRGLTNLHGRPCIPTPYCYRCPYGATRDSCGLQCAKALATEIGELGGANIAALLIEPVTGASGAAITPPVGYINAIRKICTDHDILLIADDVLTGLGRTGNWLGLDFDRVKADIVCLGKGLNAGYWPISGILLDTAVDLAIRNGSGAFGYGHTHSGHPVGSAVANAVLDVLEEQDLIEQVRQRSVSVQARLLAIADQSPLIGDVRGRGFFWGLELVENKQTKSTFPAQENISGKLVGKARGAGLNIYPSAGFAAQHHGDAVIFAPPLNTTDSDMDRMLGKLEETFAPRKV